MYSQDMGRFGAGLIFWAVFNEPDVMPGPKWDYEAIWVKGLPVITRAMWPWGAITDERISVREQDKQLLWTIWLEPIVDWAVGQAIRLDTSWEWRYSGQWWQFEWWWRGVIRVWGWRGWQRDILRGLRVLWLERHFSIKFDTSVEWRWRPSILWQHSLLLQLLQESV